VAPRSGPRRQENGNDFAYFRLAEIYLIKAEALNQQGQTAAALALVNTVRARSFNPPQPLAALTQAQLRTAIFNERLFEFAGEAKRRQDLIRAGSEGETYNFTSAWIFKPATAAYRILMPIPQTQLDNNPNLKQNPGY
jgi:hypothetical protein